MTLDPSGSAGTLVGFPWRSKTSMPITQTRGTSSNASTIIFGDWRELFIGESVIPMTVDTSADASTHRTAGRPGSTSFRTSKCYSGWPTGWMRSYDALSFSLSPRAFCHDFPPQAHERGGMLLSRE